MESADNRIEMTCPLNGELCVSGVRSDFKGVDRVGNKVRCRWWTRIKGQHPQEDRMMDHFDCAVAWTPVTILESAKQAGQTSAEVHSIVNGMAAVLTGETRQRFMQAVGAPALPDTEKKHDALPNGAQGAS